MTNLIHRELDGEDATATSSITGSVTIAGYPNGIDPSTGAVNDTLLVKYDLQGCNGTCSVLEVEDNPKFCEEVAIGEFDLDNSVGDLDIVKNVNPTANDTETIDVDTPINQFFGRPMVVEDAAGRVLACAMLKEITNNTNSDASASAEEITANDKTLSGAMGSASSAAWVFFVATTVVVAAAVSF